MIILNEYDWAEDKIKNYDLGKNPLETLIKVAKYYFANKYNKNETRKQLDLFLARSDHSASLVLWSNTLDRVTKIAAKQRMLRLDGISVSKSELAVIDALPRVQLKRLAFTLLCLAKYCNAVRNNQSNWVNTPDTQIMKMANINTSIKRQSMMYAQLNEMGLIQFSKKVDNVNICVMFLDNKNDEAVFVSDFRNLGYQYMKLYSDDFFECEMCGITLKRHKNNIGRKQKYCAGCAAEIHVKQKVDSAMRRRRKNSDLNKKIG